MRSRAGEASSRTVKWSRITKPPFGKRATAIRESSRTRRKQATTARTKPVTTTRIMTRKTNPTKTRSTTPRTITTRTRKTKTPSTPNRLELGHGGLGVGERSRVKPAGRVEQFVERRPPRSVLECPGGTADLSRLGRARDGGERNAVRADGPQRPEVKVRGCSLWLGWRHDQVVVRQFELLTPPGPERGSRVVLELDRCIGTAWHLPHRLPSGSDVGERVMWHDHEG